LDLLVNNAGVLTVGRFDALNIDAEEALIRLNVIALTRLTRAALVPMLARRSGTIINVSSIAGLAPTRFTATYGASKAYIISFTHALREELRGSGVRVQLLCPGFTRTDLGVGPGLDTDRLPSWIWTTPEAVADASIKHIARRTHVCVPGTANKLLYLLLGRLPRPLVRRIVGVGAKRGWAAKRQRETRS
jgi:short-subunit dehydrogenase